MPLHEESDTTEKSGLIRDPELDQKIKKLIEEKPDVAIRKYGDLLTLEELRFCMTEAGLIALIYQSDRLTDEQILAFAESEPTQVLFTAGYRLASINQEAFIKAVRAKPTSGIAHCPDAMTPELLREIIQSCPNDPTTLWAFAHAGEKIPVENIREFLTKNKRGLTKLFRDQAKDLPPNFQQLASRIAPDLPWITTHLPTLGKVLKQAIANLI
jgi:hypothetical protein